MSRAAHAFVADLDAPVLEPADRHHLERVLRLRPGDAVVVSDGAGRWRPCRFGPQLELDGEAEFVPAPAVRITIGFALVKGQRPELVTQKLTELGVDRVVPFVAGRSVVRWDDAKAAREVDRLRVIARAASMQSRRVWLPEVTSLRTFAEMAGTSGTARAERAGSPPSLATPTVLIGPEGGWTEDERAAPLPAVGLGEQVLRAETAAIAAAVLLSALRARLVAPVPD